MEARRGVGKGLQQRMWMSHGAEEQWMQCRQPPLPSGLALFPRGNTLPALKCMKHLDAHVCFFPVLNILEGNGKTSSVRLYD